MSQQIAVQPPHDSSSLMEYEKGGHFKASSKVVIGFLIALLLLFFALWLSWRI
jgi:hypothetical protein